MPRSEDDIREDLADLRRYADRIHVNAARVDSGTPLTMENLDDISEVIARELVEQQRESMQSSPELSVHGPGGTSLRMTNVPPWVTALALGVVGVVAIAAIVWVLK